jgi:hypothetical protein
MHSPQWQLLDRGRTMHIWSLNFDLKKTNICLKSALSVCVDPTVTDVWMLDYGHHRQSDFENKIVVLGYVTIGFDERETCNIQRVKEHWWYAP